MIRKATPEDLSRIAEILVFVKRIKFRPIFQDDDYSFGELQVLLDYVKTFDCVDHNKLWKILQEMGILGNLTHLLRNLYAGQEATVRKGDGTTNC